MYFIGIDVGKKGAISLLEEDGTHVWTIDCPLIGNDINFNSLSNSICFVEDRKAFCVIEKAQAMPKQGSVSMFNYGTGYGAYLGILSAYKIPYQKVSPRTWKKEFSLDSDKNKSIIMAKQLFPSVDVGKKDGRAEALLLAEYARRIYKR